MNKSEAKEAARDILQDAIGVAYYQLEAEKHYSENEKEMIGEYLAKEAVRMLKLVGREYITY